MSLANSVLIIFNSGPGGGKDSSVELLLHLVPEAQHHTFKKALVDATLRFYEIDPAVWQAWYTREGKELPRPELHGKSCRQALIHVSEHVLKPTFGEGCLADLFVKHCPQAPYILASDGGFDVELNVTASSFHRVYVVRLHRDGTSFNNDSRTYLYAQPNTPPNVSFFDLDNNGTLADLEEKLYLHFIVNGQPFI